MAFLKRVFQFYGYMTVLILFMGSVYAQEPVHKSKRKPKVHKAVAVKSGTHGTAKSTKPLKTIPIEKQEALPERVQIEKKVQVEKKEMVSALSVPIEVEWSGMVEPTSIKKNVVQEVSLWTSIPILKDETSKKLFTMSSQSVKIKGVLVQDKSGKWSLKVKSTEPFQDTP